MKNKEKEAHGNEAGGNHWIVNGHAGICNEVCMDFQNRRNYTVFTYLCSRKWSTKNDPPL